MFNSCASTYSGDFEIQCFLDIVFVKYYDTSVVSILKNSPGFRANKDFKLNSGQMILTCVVAVCLVIPVRAGGYTVKYRIQKGPDDRTGAGYEVSAYKDYQPITYPSAVYEPPIYKAPIYEPATYKAPIYEPPTYKAPIYEPPTYRAPRYDPAVYRAPQYEPASYRAPNYEPASYRAPDFAPVVYRYRQEHNHLPFRYVHPSAHQSVHQVPVHHFDEQEVFQGPEPAELGTELGRDLPTSVLAPEHKVFQRSESPSHKTEEELSNHLTPEPTSETPETADPLSQYEPAEDQAFVNQYEPTESVSVEYTPTTTSDNLYLIEASSEAPVTQYEPVEDVTDSFTSDSTTKTPETTYQPRRRITWRPRYAKKDFKVEFVTQSYQSESTTETSATTYKPRRRITWRPHYAEKAFKVEPVTQSYKSESTTEVPVTTYEPKTTIPNIPPNSKKRFKVIRKRKLQ